MILQVAKRIANVRFARRTVYEGWDEKVLIFLDKPYFIVYYRTMTAIRVSVLQFLQERRFRM